MAIEYIRNPGALEPRSPPGPPPSRKIDAVLVESLEGEGETCDCPVCYGDEFNVADMVKTSCGHSYCKECICKHIDSVPTSRPVGCPMCRAQVTRLEVMKPSILVEIGAKYH